MAVVRDDLGRIVKGSPPLNPTGRPKDEAGIAELARSHAPEALGVLVETMRASADPGTRIRAAQALLERGYGRPAQSVVGKISVERDFRNEHLLALKLVNARQPTPVLEGGIVEEKDGAE